MKAEIITIGDEILIGQIVDTNSAWLGQNLNPLGWEITKITTISDSETAIIEALDSSYKTADLIIMTGGLGPTNDDITKNTICKYFNVGLKFDQKSFENVERIFNHLKRAITQVNKDQALIPENSEALPNFFGTAPGIWIEHNNTILVCLPGVPYEMKDIMTNQVFPRISGRSNDIVAHKTLVVSGVPESIISEQILHIESNLPQGFKIAYLPNYGVVRVRISARGLDETYLNTELERIQKEIAIILGDFVVSYVDQRIEETVGELLSSRNESLSIAESCTGGYTAHLITSVSGSSKYFPGSVVTYSYDNKTEVLGVDADLLWHEGAVSQEVVEQMCMAVREKNNSTYGIAISGIAGPGGGTKDKPVGTVWMAVCNGESCYSKVYHLRGDRKQNIERSANLALELLRRMIVGTL